MAEDNIVQVILKLFDTLREAMVDTNSSVKSLQATISDCVHKLDLYNLDEIKKGINDHTKEASDNSNKCLYQFTNQINDVIAKLDLVHYKTKQMIAVVITAVTIFSIALFVADTFTKTPANKLEKMMHTLTETLDQHNNILLDQEKQNQVQLQKIKQLEETIKKLHRDINSD